METEKAIHSADNKVVVVLALIFGALVFMIGIVSNDDPAEIPMVQSSFDVAPSVVALPAPVDGDDARIPRLANVAPAQTAAAK